MNLKLDELKKLPHLAVRDVFQRAEECYLEGVFEPKMPEDQRLGYSCYAYLIDNSKFAGEHILSMLWASPDEQSSILKYNITKSPGRLMAAGDRLPCGSLNWCKTLLILDLDMVWNERKFQSADTWSYEDPPGWRTTLQPGTPLPPNAINPKKRSKGWDHEHCELCWATISEHGETSAFVTRNSLGREDWVCRNCYETRIAPHSL